MKIDCSQQNIIVTGGTRGIGAAITEALLECGANVIAQYHKNEQTAKRFKKEHNGNLHLIQADLSSSMEVNQFFQSCLTHFNHKIDAIVNNAGIAIASDINKNPIDWTDDWLKTMDVNVNAVGLLSMRAVQHFKENKIAGRIVNIASRAAYRGDTADYIAYATSKGAVVTLTKSIARSFGKQNIKAFTIAPGFTRTDMAQQFINQYGEDFALNDIALNELTEPKDIAPTVALMCSGLMDHATGNTVHINAGSYVC